MQPSRFASPSVFILGILVAAILAQLHDGRRQCLYDAANGASSHCTWRMRRIVRHNTIHPCSSLSFYPSSVRYHYNRVNSEDKMNGIITATTTTTGGNSGSNSDGTTTIIHTTTTNSNRIGGSGRSSKNHTAQNVALVWANETLYMIRTSSLSPPSVARTLAIVESCLYNTLAVFTDDLSYLYRIPRQGRIPRHLRTEANLNAALSQAAWTAIQDQFSNIPTHPTLDHARRLLQSYGLDPDMHADHTRSVASIGIRACLAVIQARHQDGANQLGTEANSKTIHSNYTDYTNYYPVNDASAVPYRTQCARLRDWNKWTPLRLYNKTGGQVVQKYVGAQFCHTVPFALRSGFDMMLRGPPLLGSSSEDVLLRGVEEVVQISGQLDDRKKVIAEFWADGPDSTLPPGHWHSIAMDLARKRNLSIRDTVLLLFLHANAVMDAGIASWSIKRLYDSSRPITLIQCLYENKTIQSWAGPYQGVQSIRGSEWQPYQDRFFVTPPFSEYVSGHSTFSAASAHVLRQFFGTDRLDYRVVIGAGKSLFEPKIDDPRDPRYRDGVTNVPNRGPYTKGYVPAGDIVLQYDTLSQAAADAGLSRLYGGIHFRWGNEDGLRLGEEVGKQVWRKFVSLTKWRRRWR